MFKRWSISDSDNRRLIWFCLTVALGCILLFGSFFWVSPVYKSLLDRLFDGGHMLLFAVITLVFFTSLPSGMAEKNRLAAAVLLGVVFATVAECLQPLTGRTSSAVDWRNSLVGVVCGFTGICLWRRGGSPFVWFFYVVVCLGILVLLEIPAIGEWRALRWQEKNFPVLADFESGEELRLWTPHRDSGGVRTAAKTSKQFASSGISSFHVQTVPGIWSGVTYNAGDRDWRDYHALVLDVLNPSDESFSLAFRIDDEGDCTKYADRFNKSIVLKDGWNRIEILIDQIKNGPQERELNISSIRWLYLFTRPNEPPREFYVDYVRLVSLP